MQQCGANCHRGTVHSDCKPQSNTILSSCLCLIVRIAIWVCILPDHIQCNVMFQVKCVCVCVCWCCWLAFVCSHLCRSARCQAFRPKPPEQIDDSTQPQSTHKIWLTDELEKIDFASVRRFAPMTDGAKEADAVRPKTCPADEVLYAVWSRPAGGTDESFHRLRYSPNSDSCSTHH